MKKIILAVIAIAFAITSLNAKEVTKKGFLTTDYCLKRDLFADCKLENYHAALEGKQELVLYVHEELDHYIIDPSHLSLHELDEGFGRLGVSITGKLVKKKGENVIVGHKYKGPPPPAKSFFKGCL